jgi:hypothetical protein
MPILGREQKRQSLMYQRIGSWSFFKDVQKFTMINDIKPTNTVFIKTTPSFLTLDSWDCQRFQLFYIIFHSLRKE